MLVTIHLSSVGERPSQTTQKLKDRQQAQKDGEHPTTPLYEASPLLLSALVLLLLAEELVHQSHWPDQVLPNSVNVLALEA